MRLISLSLFCVCLLILTGCASPVMIDQTKVNSMSKNEALNNLKKFSTETPWRGYACIFNEEAVGSSKAGSALYPYNEFEVHASGTVVQITHKDILTPTLFNTGKWCQLQDPPLEGGNKYAAKTLVESLIVLGAKYSH